MRSHRRLLTLTAVLVALAVTASVLLLTGGSSSEQEKVGTRSAPAAPVVTRQSEPEPTPTAAPDEEPEPEDEAEQDTTVAEEAVVEEAVAEEPEPVPEPAPVSELTVLVDPSLQPSAQQVDGLEEGDAPRPTGRMTTSHGDTTDVVLDELIVSAATEAELDAVVQRWNGVVVDRFPAIPDDPRIDALVRIDPASLDVADAAHVAADLSAVEPHDGELAVSSDRALRLLGIMAAEAADHGTIVTLNPLEESDAIVDGVVTEADDRGNVFTWSFMQGGGVQDFAVAPAWQLLEAHGRLDTDVRVMVNDGGFSSNPDFPTNVTLRHAEWGDRNRTDCGDNTCDYHGTDVLLTMAGLVDNGYGTAGVAGPLDPEVIAVAIYKDKWKRLRKLAGMVEQYRPAVVNMSYGNTTTAGRAAAQDIFDRRYRQMKNDGALLVASAGNKGLDIDQRKCVSGVCFDRRLIFPCESEYVMCVGGLQQSTTNRAGGSNYGAEDNRRSVEIWGPMTTLSIIDPENAYSDTRTRFVGGTSFASPFVAGVATLVKAADPSLGPEEIRDILNDTANVGVGGSTWITGSLRRVDALAAVSAALGVEVPVPAVQIDFPTNGESYPVSEWLQLLGSATDFAGTALPITWESSIDGQLGAQVGPVALGELTVGTHVLTATATDSAGQTGSAQVTFDVTHRPPEVVIESPGSGATRYTHQALPLRANSSDPDDFWAPVPDGDVAWSISPQGSDGVVWSASGHQAEIPPNTLGAGTYVVTVAATSPGGTAEASIAVAFQELPPGEDLPEVHVTSPGPGLDLAAASGNTDPLNASGWATDEQDGPIAGTRLRWVARSGNTEIVLCSGSHFDQLPEPPAPEPGLTLVAPGGGGGPVEPIDDVVAVVDCANTSFSLPLPPGAPNVTSWDVVLQARDSSGLVGESAPVVVGVHAAIG